MKITSPSTTDPCAWIDAAVRKYAANPFLRSPGEELNYAELAREAARYAAALRSLGVLPGERVVARLDKIPASVLLYLGCLRTGAIFVPVNVANSVQEVEYFLNDARPHVVVLRPEDQPALAPLATSAGAAHTCTLGQGGEGSFADLLRQSSPEDGPRVALPAAATAAIVYTSGTTGRSKGAMLTRGNLASNAAVLARSWRFTPQDVLLHTLPLNHVHGLFVAINTVLASASSLVLMPKFDAAAVLAALPGATVLMGVPTHYTRLLQQEGLTRAATAHMRLFISGSAPLLAETHAAFQQRTGHTILERYGMTETLMNTSNPYQGVRLPGSVGPPLPDIGVRVTRRETGVPEQAVDVIGTLEVKGPNVFCGYWQDAEKTRSEFTADGWFKTGDLGRIDAAGYVHISGRVKDLVISGGYNVYPKEVEMELDSLPGVLESAVFGVPHPDLGEGVTAAIVLAHGATVSEDELLRALAPRLARYKVPRRLLVLEELPRNAMGKVQKNLLRASNALLYST
jgi:malonyl-CoA/methylmalonyl-CoA synthetase